MPTIYGTPCTVVSYYNKVLPHTVVGYRSHDQYYMYM